MAAHSQVGAGTALLLLWRHTPTTAPLGLLDVNGDGQVTVVDLAIVALFYGTRLPVGGVNLPADVNTDGIVDLLDLTAVAQAIDAAGGVNGFSQQDVELALLIAAEQAVEIEAAAGAPGRAVTSVSVRVSTKNVSDALAGSKNQMFGTVKGVLLRLRSFWHCLQS